MLKMAEQNCWRFAKNRNFMRFTEMMDLVHPSPPHLLDA
jgi:hypothetical protein